MGIDFSEVDINKLIKENNKRFKEKQYSRHEEDEGIRLGVTLVSKPKKAPVEKVLKTGNIMKARSDLKKKGSKYEIETEMNVKKGLEPNVKRALKKSVLEEVKKKIVLDLDDSSEDEKPKKGKGIYNILGMKKGPLDDDSSDEEEDRKRKEKKAKEEKLKLSKPNILDLNNYKRMLHHLLSHIEDPKEPIDEKDYKDSKKIIDDMKVVKKRGRPRKN